MSEQEFSNLDVVWRRETGWDWRLPSAVAFVRVGDEWQLYALDGGGWERADCYYTAAIKLLLGDLLDAIAELEARKTYHGSEDGQ